MKCLSKVLLSFLAMIIAPAAIAQTDCPLVIQTVMDRLDTVCGSTSRNQACYGNLAVDAEPRGDVSQFKFENVGDIARVSAIRALRVSGFDLENNIWGVALMRLQANLPDALPGENVTFLLMGDVEIVSATPDTASEDVPMRAFYLRTGIGEPACVDVPQNGMLVQTPEGRGQVNFSINGVDIALGSTALFQAQAGGVMRVATIEGAAALHSGRRTVPVVAGTQVTVPLNENYIVEEEPNPVTSYDAQEFQSLPLQTLEREIEVAPPLNDAQVDLVNSFIELDAPACGPAPFLPDCEDFPAMVGGELCEIGPDGSTPVCDDDPPYAWDDFEVIPVVDDNEHIVPLDEVESTATPEAAAPPAIEPTLPPGCVPGICLQDASVACQCVLCGVKCPQPGTEIEEPVSTIPPDSSDSGGQPQNNDTGSNDNSDGSSSNDQPVTLPTNPPPTTDPCPGPLGCSGPPGS